MHPRRAFTKHDPRGAVLRLVASVTLGAVAFLALSGVGSVAVRAVAAWDVGGTALLVILWTIIARSDVAETQRRAAAEDPGRGVAWALVLVGSTFSVFGGTAVMRQGKTLAPGASAAFCALALIAVIVAWALTHTVYALRYAHLYYRDDHEGVGGIELPGGAKPGDFDFAYFSFVIGMCFQVSDFTISSSQIRRAVLLHSVLSFAYNTAVVALALNLAFGAVG